MRVEIILLCDKKEPMERHETSRAVYEIGYISLTVNFHQIKIYQNQEFKRATFSCPGHILKFFLNGKMSAYKCLAIPQVTEQSWMRQMDGEIIMKLIVSVRSGENFKTVYLI